MEKINGKFISNEAGVAGLAFGIISGGYCFIPATKISSILAVIKLAGLIWLMLWFMRRLNRNYKDVSVADTRKFGRLTAFYSALVTAVCYYVASAYVYPEVYEEAVQTVINSGVFKMDSNQMAALDNLKDKIPVYGLVSNLIYCYLYGTILSAILAPRVSNSSPFGKSSEDDADDDII